MYVIGHSVSLVYLLAQCATFVLFGLLVLDIYSLYREKDGLSAERIHDAKLSNGDDNEIKITMQSNYSADLKAEVVDEIPHQFQRRDISWKIDLPSGAQKLYPCIRRLFK